MASLILALGAGSVASADFCGSHRLNSRPSLALTLTPLQRAELLCDFKEAMDSKYALLDFKHETLKINVIAQIDDCAEHEMDYASHEFSDLDFYDRVRRCLAPIRDEHLTVNPQTAIPSVTAGMGIVQIGQRFYVAWVNSRVLALSHLEDTVKVGMEVTALDGKPVAQRLKRIAAYISAGSPAALRSLALKALTDRDFLLPKTAKLSVTFADQARPVQMPWWALGPNSRQDTRSYFQKAGIHNIQSVDPQAYTRISQGADLVGFRDDMPLSKKTVVSLLDDRFKVGLRLGAVQEQDTYFCYIQLLTFAAKQWTLGTDGSTLGFIDPIEAVIRQCQHRGFPTVLDLRNNNGGNPDFAERVAALLVEPGKVLPPLMMSLRLSPNAVNVLNKLNFGEGFPTPPPSLFSVTTAYQALQNAQANRKDYIDFVPHANIAPSPDVNGYVEPVTVITGPNCVSACERLVSMLQNRATIVGLPTAGTSSGTWTFGITPAAEWRDDKYDSVTIPIPNAIFAVLDRPLASAEYLVDFDSHRDLVVENRPIPTSAGWSYSLTLDDLNSNGSGLLTTAIKSLQKPASLTVR